MADYSREIDIGKVKQSSNVAVSNFSEVVTVLDKATHKIEETTEELKKVSAGAGLITGTDLDEEEV